ncbi:hypothetical protein PU629_10800 [Pullulanibacillus sp. KACC 23026]|nr:hypothetical protein [Pullulanibacillus sp. KACC 23026]WEG14799.1 hypothetical protein PU629_10800 [Pullulanibacillus sp. KACC 23026]
MAKDFIEDRINHIKQSIECLQEQNGSPELLSEAQEFLAELEKLKSVK